MVSRTISGNGVLIVGSDEAPVSYRLTRADTASARRVEGRLAGPFPAFYKALTAGLSTLRLADGFEVAVVVTHCDSSGAVVHVNTPFDVAAH